MLSGGQPLVSTSISSTTTLVLLAVGITKARLSLQLSNQDGGMGVETEGWRLKVCSGAINIVSVCYLIVRYMILVATGRSVALSMSGSGTYRI